MCRKKNAALGDAAQERWETRAQATAHVSACHSTAADSLRQLERQAKSRARLCRNESMRRKFARLAQFLKREVRP